MSSLALRDPVRSLDARLTRTTPVKEFTAALNGHTSIQPHAPPLFPPSLRISRNPVPAIHDESYEFVPGRSVTVRQGVDVTLVANGTVLWRALAAAELLAVAGIEARVLSMASVKPLDTGAIVDAARETGAIVTVEEAIVGGGLGGAVAETVVDGAPRTDGHARLPRLLRYGLVGPPHREGRHGSRGHRGRGPYGRGPQALLTARSRRPIPCLDKGLRGV